MTQREQVSEYCQSFPSETFLTLQQVYTDLPHLLQPTVRNLLQRTRDDGTIRFVDNVGLYQVV